MSARKPIGKKLRFEVFKRDNFTCQYCGATAPEAILHVDHMNPVAGGGTNDILNLVTSCEACNLGKGAREISDQSVLAKQRAQLEELSYRREQLEMMVQWREGLADLQEQEIDAFNAYFSQRTGCTLNDVGRGDLATWLKRHAIGELLAALDGALGTYYKEGDADDSERNNSLAGKAFSMVPRVIAAQKRNADKPWMKDLFYVRAIIRNRMHCNERVAIDLIEQAYDLGAHIEELKDWAKTARNWTNWRNEMEEWINSLRGGEL